MRRIQTSALFNAWLSVPAGELHNDLWTRLGASTEALHQHDAATGFIAGVVDWREKRPEAAIAHWQQTIKDYPAASVNAHAALQHASAGGVSQNGPELVAQIAELLSTD